MQEERKFWRTARRIFISFGVCLFLLLSFGWAGAEPTLEWNPASAGPITTWPAAVTGKGRFVLQPFGYYNRTRGSFDDGGAFHSLAANESRWQKVEQILGLYGLTDRDEISLQLTFLELHSSLGRAQATTRNLGDTLLFYRYKFCDDEGGRPCWTGFSQLKIPTGKYQGANPGVLGTDIMGTGSYDIGLGFNVSKKLRPFLFHFNLYATFPFPTSVDGAQVVYSPYINCNLAAEYFLGRGLSLMAELNGFSQGSRRENSLEAPDTRFSILNLIGGVGWTMGDVKALVGIQRTLAGVNVDAFDSFVGTVYFPFGK